MVHRMNRKLIDDCFAHDDRMLRHAEAISLLRQRIVPVVDQEIMPAAGAVGRILAEPVTAPRPIPLHDNSAVDGFGFAFNSYDPRQGSRLPVTGRVAAGHPLRAPVVTGQAVRIFTGAMVPQGVDTVVMQEDVALEDDGRRVGVPPGLKAGSNIRKAGEDVPRGSQILTAGQVLRPQDLATLASVGLAEVRCFERANVAVLSSGDEIVRPGQPLVPGQVYDANSPMLCALVACAGANARDEGVLPDKREAVVERLADAARSDHVVITSGGASRGEEDHLAAAVDRLGQRHLWRLAIKPGRPIAFGQIGDCIVVSLPGNPVAMFVCFVMYVWPLLRRLGGAPWPEPRRLRLPAAFSFKGRKTGRREFWRGMLQEGPQGPAVGKFERDGSGLISSLRAADGLIDIPEEHGDVQPGDLVDFLPLADFGIIGR
jgi:molybdopterin molybdotransferase